MRLRERVTAIEARLAAEGLTFRGTVEVPEDESELPATMQGRAPGIWLAVPESTNWGAVAIVRHGGSVEVLHADGTRVKAGLA